MLNNGWYSTAKVLESKHFNDRPDPACVNLLVIHNISLPPNQFQGNYVEDFFTGRLDFDSHQYFSSIKDLKVSSHFYIRRNGEIVQFVPTQERAWHAGVSCFEGVENCNDFSIGVELAGSDEIPYTQKQYLALAKLTKCLIHNYPAITEDRIVGHCHIAPNRKTDPGNSFDWKRYKELIRVE